VLNAAGYYTEPTPANVAVSLLQAKINTDESNPATYLTQDLSGVYTNADPRNYELSSYSYFILPTKIGGQFTEAKGRTLAAFTYYAMCEAQQQSASLGYAPLPVNLVTASFDQIAKIPGAEVQNISLESCDNPTFSPSGEDLLAANAPQPQECDRQGPAQCASGTGGVPDVPTPVDPPPGNPSDPGGVRGSFTVVEPSGPCLVVRNTAVDFGDLVAGDATATRADGTTGVENCGDAPLEVSVRVSDATKVEPDRNTFLRAVPCTVNPPGSAACPKEISATSFGYGSVARLTGAEPASVFPTGSVAVRSGAPVDLEHFVVAPDVGAPTSAFEFVITYTGVATS
jgi:phosphate transport system substrate-binding protein